MTLPAPVLTPAEAAALRPTNSGDNSLRPQSQPAPVLTPAEAATLRKLHTSAKSNTNKPAAIQPAASNPTQDLPLIEARPLPLQVAEKQPALAPIVSSQSLPRPAKKLQVTTAMPQPSGAWLAEVRQALAEEKSGSKEVQPVLDIEPAEVKPPSPLAIVPARPAVATIVPPTQAKPMAPPLVELPALPKQPQAMPAIAPVVAPPLVELPALPKQPKAEPALAAVSDALPTAAAPTVAAPAAPVAKPSVAKASVAEPVFLAQPAPQPMPPLGPAPAGPAANPAFEFNPLPAGSPFEAIQESGTVTVAVRRSLLMRTKTDIYRTAVVDESIVDVVQFTPREISLIGRAQGSTHVTFWFDDPAAPPLTYLVKVEPDAQVLKEAEFRFQMLEDLINEMFPDSKIHLVPLADKLLVKGQVRDSEEAAQIMTVLRTQGGGAFGNGNWGGVGDSPVAGVIPAAATGLARQPIYQLINMLRVPGVQQVALKVKIAELNRTAARSFGVGLRTNVNWGDLANGTKLFVGTLITPTSGSSVLANISGDDVTLGLSYLQEHGVARLLSEPTLVTLSGRPATFVAGGEFAVPTIVGSVGLNAVTTDFRAFGAIISFLPTVVDKDRVRLQVSPEFSQINAGLSVGGTPGLNVRMATTTVEMREGQTLAIAGLLEDNFKATTAGDIPFLAKLLGRRSASRNETELIILVTPELMQPMEPEEVPPLPGFDVTEPTGGEFFLHGDIEGTPTRDHRTTVWPHLKKRYQGGGPAMTSGPFGHGQ